MNENSTGKMAYCVVGEGYACTVFGCPTPATTSPYGTPVWDGAAFCDDHWQPEDVRKRAANLRTYNDQMSWSMEAASTKEAGEP